MTHLEHSTRIKQLRFQLRARRNQLSKKEHQSASDTIQTTAINFLKKYQPNTVAIYLAQDSEPAVTQIIDYLWAHDLTCCLPVLCDTISPHLMFRRYTSSTELFPNRFNIPEPEAQSPAVSADQLDMVFTPLVGFSECCQRLGMGGGYYDRTFAFKRDTQNNPPLLVGLAFDCQKTEDDFTQPWDIPLDIIVTETKTYYNPSLQR